MAYRGGEGIVHPEYGGGGHVWQPPAPSSLRELSPAAAPARALSPAAAPFRPATATAVHYKPAATGLRDGAHQHVVVYRTPAPNPYASAAPISIRAPRPSPATVRAPSTATAPFQTSRVSAPPPAPAPLTSNPSIAQELEQKLFVAETALAPTAAVVSAAQPEVDLAPVSKKGLAHPARPGAGTAGRKVMIRANHFLVNVANNNLFQYDVSINPESKSRQTNREVLSELIKVHGKTSLGGKLPAYDGRKSLYTAGSLPFESEEFTVTLVDPEKKDKERAEREYKITIRIAGRTDLYHLQQFLCGRQRDMPQETIQVLDVVLRESPSWNYVTVSRSFFSTTFGHRGDIGEGLECWRYYQSLRPTQMGLSLNIDISATSFFKPVTVIQFVQEFLNLRDVSRPLNDRDRVKIKKALRGVRVETNHQQDQIRRYKITGITAMPMSQLIFPVDERGTRMSVVQYFSQKYEYNLQHTNWPCLLSGSDARPVYLPMEACKIVEGQRYSKKLNDKQVTNILRATCQRPQQREQSIREMVLHNKYAEDKFAQEFGIKVCNDLVSVPARVLPPPMLKYHDSGREKTCAPGVGQWNMIGKKMINGGTIDNWACLSFSRMRPEEIYRFCCDVIQMCNATEMSVNPRPVVDIRTTTPNNIENTLRDVHRKTKEIIDNQGKGKGGQLQLLVVILPEVTGSYGKIKKVCETDLGIVSQCCLPRHASRPNKQYLENVALKINVKAGGRNTVLKKAFVRNGIPFVSEIPTIIFGADVTHPPPGEDSASSIAAVVASMDWPEITKYRGLVSAQPHRQEIIEDLFSVTKDPQKGTTVNGGMIRELLIAFRRKTGRRPERIIFYRDGVSEVQFSHVLLHEMDALRKACASLEEGYLPPVTSVVVQRRHHTRLCPEVHGKREMTDKSGNILPGTVVDLMICHPTEFDFYLCSHAGIQGTIRPTHYHVLYDENNFTADALQSLTNNLCYTYARCSRAISIGSGPDNNSGEAAAVQERHCRKFQALVHVLDFKILVIPLTSESTVGYVVDEAFTRLKLSFRPIVHVNEHIAGANDLVSSFMLHSDIDCSVYVTAGLLGGARRRFNEHIEHIAETVFEVVTQPQDFRAGHIPPFLVSLGSESIFLVKLLFSLLYDECHAHPIPLCPDRFNSTHIIYNTRTKTLSFDPDLEFLPFNRKRYYHNLEDIAYVLIDNFTYDYTLILNNAPRIHVPYGAAYSPSFRFPPLLDYLFHDLCNLIPNLPLHIDALHTYMFTHIGTLSLAGILGYTTSFDLDTEYGAGEHFLEDLVGLRLYPLPAPEEDPHPLHAPHEQIPDFEDYAKLSPSLAWMLNEELNLHGRKYDFKRIGAKMSLNRNHTCHANDYSDEITVKQITAYGILVFPGLIYNIRLRTLFSEAPVDWAFGPPSVHYGALPGPANQSNLDGLNQQWLRNDFTAEELVQISSCRIHHL